MKITQDAHVSFHYALESEAGEVLDGSRDGEPLTYIHGHRQIVPGLEAALEGREPGERFRQRVPASEGYGERDKSKVLELEREAFAGMPGLKIGLFCQIEDEQGEMRLGKVVALDTRQVTVDTNHPFAGQDLLFDIEVLSVRAATAQELSELG
ncbi:peptidylprolyl isomerase [Marinobacterium sp. AK62]|uniref:Peptidyl-prolyl cis-trans isomerase n=1 Tax=Marinobacterium alkalitolerans TaxID=1542925 RepID=A0ABS3Z853_9GAMM|nr:peptidylprolyl isomerase [Marinobacterium alkalitolerans]MBP0047868.1 peptidylprolyl isomerase [Marinobacterium alkalitolerans]